MDEGIVRGIYEDVREEYYFPHTRLEFTDDENVPFYCTNGVVTVNPNEFMDDEKYCRSLLRHECGHFCYMPLSIADHKRYVEIARNILKKINPEYARNIELIAHINNVVYDCIVDEFIMTELGDDLAHTVELGVERMREKGNGKLPDHPFWQILSSFYNCICGKEIITGLRKKEKKDGKRITNIVRDFTPNSEKIRKIITILSKYSEFQDPEQDRSMSGEGEDGGEGEVEQYEGIAKFIKDLEDLMDKDYGITLVREDLEEDSEKAKKRELENAVNPDGDEDEGGDKIVSCGIGAGGRPILEPYEYYRGLAKKKIKFKVKITKPCFGHIEKGSLQRWTLDSPIERLDIEESIQESPLIIPEATTVEFEAKRGEDEGRDVPDVLLITDTSGSMSKDIAIITTYSMIESARLHKVKAGVVLFTTPAYLSEDFTYDYSRVERSIWEEYLSGGTNTLNGVIEGENLVKNHRGNALIIFISDFECNNTERTADRLRELQSQGNIITVLKIEEHDGNYSKEEYFKGLNVKIVEKLEDLSGLVIGAVEELV